MDDIAKDTFLAKVHPIIRWVLFIPVGLLGAVLIPVIVAIAWNIVTGIDEKSLLLQITQDFWTGMSFVGIGTYVAPKHQFVVSIILLVMLTIMGVLVYLLNFQTNSVEPIMMLIHALTMIISGILFVYIMHKHDQKQHDINYNEFETSN